MLFPNSIWHSHSDKFSNRFFGLFICLFVCRFVKGNIYRIFAHCFVLNQIKFKIRSYCTSFCVWWVFIHTREICIGQTKQLLKPNRIICYRCKNSSQITWFDKREKHTTRKNKNVNSLRRKKIEQMKEIYKTLHAYFPLDFFGSLLADTRQQEEWPRA